MQALESLVEALNGRLFETEGAVAIHAGHFQVEVDPRTGGVYPAVVEELIDRLATTSVIASVRERIGIFPTATFLLATELVTRLQASNRSARILTLVNDQTASIRQNAREMKWVREQFFQEQALTLPVYEQILKSRGLDPMQVLIGLQSSSSLISEVWLRECFRTRLRFDPEARTQLSASGPRTLVLDGLHCPIMSKGQATCAGEVAELHLRLKALGFKVLVNFYPLICRGFVEASVEIADRLWGLDDYQVIDVGLPASGEQTAAELMDGLRLHQFP